MKIIHNSYITYVRGYLLVTLGRLFVVRSSVLLGSGGSSGSSGAFLLCLQSQRQLPIRLFECRLSLIK
jgi:hypothetical protein